MANSDRRYFDKNGKTFVPMNVEGSTYADTWMTTPKMITIILVILSAIVVGLAIGNNGLNFFQGLIWYIIWLFIVQFPIRYIVFEEKLYYAAYKDIKNKEITTPDSFWDVASIKNTGDGAVLTYAFGRVAVILKVERDTITGKPVGFREQHEDAISDFYRELITNNYCVVSMNLMEPAVKDNRLKELDKITTIRDNENSAKLVQYEVGYLKNITKQAMFENDYFLIYSNDINRVDTIIQDTVEAAMILMDGAFSDFELLDIKGIADIEKECTGVGMFNIAEASLNMYNSMTNTSVTKTFDIEGIEWANGEYQILNQAEKNKVNNIISKAKAQGKAIDKYSLQRAIYRESDIKFEFDYNDLSKVPGQSDNRNTGNDDYIDF